jgi:AcrR family transcriptional regulator
LFYNKTLEYYYFGNKMIQGIVQAMVQAMVQGMVQGIVQAMVQGMVQGIVQAMVQGMVQGMVQENVPNRLQICLENNILSLIPKNIPYSLLPSVFPNPIYVNFLFIVFAHMFE